MTTCTSCSNPLVCSDLGSCYSHSPQFKVPLAMTPTPRTDANESITCKEGDPCIAPDFARQLERENAEMLGGIGKHSAVYRGRHKGTLETRSCSDNQSERSSTMTPEQQRIAIAEACGIVGSFDNRWIKEYEKEGGDAYGFTGFENGELVFVPNYLNDLNAMHEAEKTLKLGMRNLYDANLDLIAERDHCFIWETTAAQRAEAFLKTLGLWEETK